MKRKKRKRRKRRKMPKIYANDFENGLSLSSEKTERVARTIYKSWVFGRQDSGRMSEQKCPWVFRGNSQMQRDARVIAIQAMKAMNDDIDIFDIASDWKKSH